MGRTLKPNKEADRLINHSYETANALEQLREMGIVPTDVRLGNAKPVIWILFCNACSRFESVVYRTNRKGNGRAFYNTALFERCELRWKEFKAA